MDAKRIEELQREYDVGLEDDKAAFAEMLAQLSPEERQMHSSDIEAVESSGDEYERLFATHRLLDSDEFRERFKEERGNDSYLRLFWAYSYLDESGAIYDRYRDATYFLPAGDYYVTDPCYIVTGNDWGPDIWYAEDLSDLGIETSFMRDTIFGDWGCSLIDSDTDEQLGVFGADAGMVVVADKAEVDEYNPDFEEWVASHGWCVAVIHGFEGNLTFKVDEEPYEDFGGGVDYVLTLVFEGAEVSSGRPWNMVGGMF